MSSKSNGAKKPVPTTAEQPGSIEPQTLLLNSDQDFRILAESLPVGVFVLAELGTVAFANQNLLDIYGVDSMERYDWLDAVHPEDRDQIDQAFGRLGTESKIDITLRILTATGRVRWCRLAAHDLRHESGLANVVGFIEDITEVRYLQARLEKQATTDALTSLPNRAALLEYLTQALRADTQSTTCTAVLFIDLDGFKDINDTQGHSVGDSLLEVVAKRFASTIRPGDLIARFGGDEFVVVAKAVTKPDDVLSIAQRLHEAISTPISINGQSMSTTASIGVALNTSNMLKPDEILGDADLAMYEAKRQGRARTVVYHSGLREQASQRFDIHSDLRHARNRREFRLHYQPILDLSGGSAVGMEALIRWDHPAHGLLHPASFISVAEERGVIESMGDWVVEQATADLAKLRHEQLVAEDFFVSINVSTMQLSKLNDLATTAETMIGRHGLAAGNLIFELTESIPIDAIPEATLQLNQLTARGFGLAIDDFGTGYASLDYLTMLPFDIMKIDHQFTARLSGSDQAEAILESLMVLARRLNFSVVAEGIETLDQRRLTAGAGIHWGQGYLFARPAPLPKLAVALAQGFNNIASTN